MFEGNTPLSEGAQRLQSSEEFQALGRRWQGVARVNEEARGLDNRIRNSLSRFLNDVGAKDVRPLSPSEYFDSRVRDFFEFWGLMVEHGEYSHLVRYGFDPCVQKLLAALRSPGGSTGQSERVDREMADMLSRMYEEIFAMYRSEMISSKDYNHHLPGEERSMFESPAQVVSRKHEAAFCRHDFRLESGIEAGVVSLWKRMQDRLEALEDEFAIHRKDETVLNSDNREEGRADDSGRRPAELVPADSKVYWISSIDGLVRSLQHSDKNREMPAAAEAIFYFTNPLHEAAYEELSLTLESRRNQDAITARVPFRYWPHEPGSFKWGDRKLDWSRSAKSLFRRREELRKTQGTELDKAAFCEALIVPASTS